MIHALARGQVLSVGEAQAVPLVPPECLEQLHCQRSVLTSFVSEDIRIRIMGHLRSCGNNRLSNRSRLNSYFISCHIPRNDYASYL